VFLTCYLPSDILSIENSEKINKYMAEGGGEFGDGDLIHFHDNDHDDDDDEQEVNRTQPFQPGAASTPYHGG